jgi:hypothetical protein
LTFKERNVILYEETRAWEKGKIIAKSLKIRLGKQYDILATKSLDTYRENFKIYKKE